MIYIYIWRGIVFSLNFNSRRGKPIKTDPNPCKTLVKTKKT